MDDIYFLIATLCNVNVDNYEYSHLADMLYDKYEIDIDSFSTLISELLPLCTVAKSSLTETYYRGFGKDGIWIIKEKLNNDLSSN